MFRQQLNQLSKITASIKYASASTVTLLALTSEDAMPSPSTIEHWIQETRRGMDCFFNDQFETAQTIFIEHANESPFHAIGSALIAYVEAMLGFEPEKIDAALHLIHVAEVLSRQFAKRVRRRQWKSKGIFADPHTHTHTPQDTESMCNAERTKSSGYLHCPADVQYVLLETNCMLMSATLQFLRSSWIEYMKAAYRLRKAYKMYEHLFETLTGQKAFDYAAKLRMPRQEPETFKETADPNTHSYINSVKTAPASLWSEKHLGVFHRRPSKSAPDIVALRKRAQEKARKANASPAESAIESGVFFGIGLFSLIFSLVPPKVNSLLNTLGFHSSRPFAIHLLKESYNSHGLYSSLSALTLLAYYTNLSIFIHPHLLPRSFTITNARSILNEMKAKYPQGRLWKLLEGKLCRMEGNVSQSVEILKTTVHAMASDLPSSGHAMKESGQLHALAVYEMGWGQLFLGDYSQATRTFFRLESMNNWSRAFYHYIATCCLFANGQYDKAALEFLHILVLLDRKRHLGLRLVPNEVFAERKIKRWKEKVRDHRDFETADPLEILSGPMLCEVIVVHPLWELVYLWNGMCQLPKETLKTMKMSLTHCLEESPQPGSAMANISSSSSNTEDSNNDSINISISRTSMTPTEKMVVLLLLGVVERELGEYEAAEVSLLAVIAMEHLSMHEDVWVVPHALYEMAALRCFQYQAAPSARGMKEAKEWVRRSENFFGKRTSMEGTSENADADWENRLYVRCQLLLERLDG
ncbi:outer membrane protein Iml2/Tetratricopeptide repeat protein 39 [Spinellus fusiger]|nr:outer membrane protein Iml2/Tetratricopeptide repeat protein 39 [Spinellus fusiger]